MTILINKKTHQTPDSFDDLTYKAYAKMLQILDSSDDIMNIKRQAVEYLLGLKPRFWKQLEASWGEDSDAFYADMFEMCKAADFLFEVIHDEITQKTYTTKSEKRGRPPFLQYRKRHAPHPKLENITFMEWAYLDTFYSQYQSKPSAELYHKIIAILYRPKSADKSQHDIDIRMSLGKYYPNLPKHVASIAKWHTDRKKTAFHFFISSRRYIVKMYPNFFIKGSGSGQAINYAHLITDLAGEKFGTVEKTQTQNIHAVLTYLNLFAKRDSERRFQNRLNTVK